MQSTRLKGIMECFRRFIVLISGSILFRRAGKKRLLISLRELVFSLADDPDMLSPTLSAPSASLLRFLRSQTGISAAPSSCAYLKRLAGRGKAFSTGSPKLTSWMRPDATHSSAAFDTGLCANIRGRPNAKAALSPLLVPMQLTSSRHASTKSRPFLRRLFDLKRNKASDYQNQSPPGPGFMDEGTEGMFNIGRSLSAKASNELRIRCTEFDTNGDVTLVNGEFRKQELIAKVCLENTNSDF
jgi:magnesium transporter